jgi:hypothetical protein
MNFQELITEACNRGFTDMLDSGAREARVKRYVNAAHREVVDVAPWPFLPAEVEGTTPIAITDLAHVLSVSDITQDRPLDPIDERQIAELDPDRDDTGSPIYWYRTDLTHLDAWPSGSSTLKVRYVRRATEMTEPTDLPLTPEEYDELLVSGTVIRLYRSRDNFEAAQFERQEWRAGLEGMKHALLKPNYDKERSIVRSGDCGDYL